MNPVAISEVEPCNFITQPCIELGYEGTPAKWYSNFYTTENLFDKIRYTIEHGI